MIDNAKRFTNLREYELIKEALSKVYVCVDPINNRWRWIHPDMNDKYLAEKITRLCAISPPLTETNIKTIRHTIGTLYKKQPKPPKPPKPKTITPTQLPFDFQLLVPEPKPTSMPEPNDEIIQLKSIVAQLESRITALEDAVTRPGGQAAPIDLDEMLKDALKGATNG